MTTPFSSAGYRRLLEASHHYGYRSIRCDGLLMRQDPLQKQLLLRHDVDVSLDYALEMAKCEAELEIVATYFVMLRSPMYNLWSRHNNRILRELVALGHGIGLHFDAAYLAGNERSVDAWIACEAATLEALAGTKVAAFSLHQPTAEMIQRRMTVAGLVNTYHPDQMAGFTYLSDSNRNWRGNDPMARMEAGEPRLHLLIHPIWWMNQNPTTEGCWNDAIRLNFSRTQEQLVATEGAYGPARMLRLEVAPQKAAQVGTGVELKPMTQASLEEHLAQALALEEGSGLPAWNAENFRYELPQKWTLSRWIFHPGMPEKPIGYAVLSRKAPQNIHLHRLVVAPTGLGFGAQAMRQLLQEVEPHARFITVKTQPLAPRARLFYEALGFVLLATDDSNHFLVRPL